jgi:ATP-binding cassette subfamily B protein/subfamily B ATP-binding cassette protein MsbA
MTIVFLAMLLRIGLDVLRPWPMKLLVDQVLGGKPMPAGLDRLTALLPEPDGVRGLLFWVCVTTVVLSFAGKLSSMA